MIIHTELPFIGVHIYNNYLKQMRLFSIYESKIYRNAYSISLYFHIPNLVSVREFRMIVIDYVSRLPFVIPEGAASISPTTKTTHMDFIYNHIWLFMFTGKISLLLCCDVNNNLFVAFCVAIQTRINIVIYIIKTKRYQFAIFSGLFHLTNVR